jgi:hypothetical protein
MDKHPFDLRQEGKRGVISLQEQLDKQIRNPEGLDAGGNGHDNGSSEPAYRRYMPTQF